ncbi:MAG: hypothetical protein IKE60_21200 [Reyranella sp.]|jgi:hypothetical protein|uniref:hypothetical protein n=1 Tax=Reyranella sp. TaxID=1929291 RepID=UPI0025EC5906|nr:hypothetical protein [Reyranella sp.]MBR2817189.1 hypothetical protein [Reyranella sp.]
MPSPYDAVTAYFHAKDGNRPFLMRRAFAPDVQLEMVVKTEAISFPSTAQGLAEVEEVLVRRIATDFENVYSFGLARPTEADRLRFSCPWLVAMSARSDGALRVGVGRYDWQFSPDARCLVERLVITIDVMQVLPAAELERIIGWVAGLPYPWCRPDEVIATMPANEALSPIARYLKAQ